MYYIYIINILYFCISFKLVIKINYPNLFKWIYVSITTKVNRLNLKCIQGLLSDHLEE